MSSNDKADKVWVEPHERGGRFVEGYFRKAKSDTAAPIDGEVALASSLASVKKSPVSPRIAAILKDSDFKPRTKSAIKSIAATGVEVNMIPDPLSGRSPAPKANVSSVDLIDEIPKNVRDFVASGPRPF